MKKLIFFYFLCTFTVNAFAWITPTMYSPADGSVEWTGLNFDWGAVATSENYEIQIDTTPNFNSVAFQNKIEIYINSSSSNSDTQEPFSDLYFGTTYYWRVRAWITGDTSAWSAVRFFDTYNFVPKTSPTNGSVEWTGLNLNWSSHAGVDFYELQLDTSANFNSTVLQTRTDTYINSSSSNLDTEETFSDLYFGTTYYWRVRAINAVDTSAWLGYWTFDTYNFVPLLSPSNLAVNQSTTGIGLDWGSHSGVDFYELQWDTTNMYNSSVLQSQVTTYINSSSSNSDTYNNSGALLANQTYHWRVRAINAVDTSMWTSRVFSTGTSITVPQTPVLISPIDGVTVTSLSVPFNWNSATNATNYEIQYSQDINFNTNVSNTTSNTSFNVVGLTDGISYYWRVRSINGGFYSNWSSIWYFNMACKSSASISVTSCGSYVSPSGNVWTSSNTYIDTISNVAGCDSVITINLTIYTVDTTTTTNGLTITSNAVGASYQWIDCNNNQLINGETNQSYTATANGNYAVIVTANSCTDTSACVIISTVDIMENRAFGQVYVYPNPFSVFTTIKFDNITGNTYSLDIFDFTGKLVRNISNITNNKITLYRKNLNSGIYLIQLKNNNKIIYTNKLIIE